MTDKKADELINVLKTTNIRLSEIEILLNVTPSDRHPFDLSLKEINATLESIERRISDGE